MNELTLEEQKLLTEFLGECWHDVNYSLHVSGISNCEHCGRPHWDTERLDFSDWRVIGRLIERLKQQAEVTIFIPHKDMLPVLTAVKEALWYKDSQLAICRAILSYLKEGEK